MTSLWRHNHSKITFKRYICNVQGIRSRLIPNTTMFDNGQKKSKFFHYDVTGAKCSTMPEWHETVLDSWHHGLPESTIKKHIYDFLGLGLMWTGLLVMWISIRSSNISIFLHHLIPEFPCCPLREAISELNWQTIICRPFISLRYSLKLS